MQADTPAKTVIQGFLYVVIEKATLPSIQGQVVCHLSLGAVAKCQTKPLRSQATVNQVFLIEVPQNLQRLIIEFKEGQNVIGDCRYDVNPFFNHPGAPHSMASDIFDNHNENKGSLQIKITYFSAQWGKIKLRVFHLSMTQPFVQKFKTARLRAKIGVFAQTSLEWQMDQNFDQRMELLVLGKNLNLQFQVVAEEGVMAKYTIYDLDKSGLLLNETKAYQVSLFNGDKAVGSIKYQIDWIHT